MKSTPDMLARLAAFRSVSRDPNEEMIRFIAQELSEAGGEVRVLPGEWQGKANLIARFGPPGGDGIVLSGHSDVVPVDGQDWSNDPFTLTEQDGRLLARGASDMKGFIAAAMTAAARSRRQNLRRPLHIAVSHDEETGCLGVRSMLATLKREGFTASGCIIGEPTGLRVALGHKGKVNGCICCHGLAAHSANPRLGCNAIYLAMGMIQELRDLQEFLRTQGAHDAAYAVPYSTVQAGTIHGGTVLNIVPERCDVEFEIRYLPGDNVAAVLDRLRVAASRVAAEDEARGLPAEIEVLERNAYPGVETAPDSPIAALAMAASGTQVPYKTGFGTEAGLFSAQLGLDCVVCGPGDIDRAHKPDEYITRDELEGCDAFLDRIVDSLC